MNDLEQFQRAIQECYIQLPLPPHDAMWRHFFLSLFTQVNNSEENEERQYKEKVWDFCVIHSNHPSDHQIAKTFVRLLETSLGINGKSMGDVALGENTLEAASTMVQGSSKVFVLVSKHLEHAGMSKFVFQEALMQQLQRPDWRCKIIPMYLPGPYVRPPFFMANIQGFKLGDDPRTVELVSGAISVEEQMQVRAIRSRDKSVFRARLKRLRKHRLREIQDVISGLRQNFGDEYDPTEQLQQTVLQLNSLTLDDDNMGGSGQYIKMSSCQAISVGPSFHFHGSHPDNSSSTNSNTTTTTNNNSSSSPQSTDFDSSIYFNPETLSNSSTLPTLSTTVSPDCGKLN